MSKAKKQKTVLMEAGVAQGHWHAVPVPKRANKLLKALMDEMKKEYPGHAYWCVAFSKWDEDQQEWVCDAKIQGGKKGYTSRMKFKVAKK